MGFGVLGAEEGTQIHARAAYGVLMLRAHRAGLVLSHRAGASWEDALGTGEGVLTPPNLEAQRVEGLGRFGLGLVGFMASGFQSFGSRIPDAV